MSGIDQAPAAADSVIDSFAERRTCPLCAGPRGDAAIEHVPPQSLNNKRPVRAFELLRVINDPEYEGVAMERGHGYYSLCDDCNNRMGTRYVPPLKRWEDAAKQAHGLAGTRIQGDFYLLRLIKGILAMFVSANTDLDEHHALREFIRDGERRGLPAPYRLYAFSRQGPFKRATGTIGVIKYGEVFFQSEVHTDHVGYVLSLSEAPLSSFYTDISHFADYGYKDLVPVDLPLDPLVVATAYPFDYRNSLMIAEGVSPSGILVGRSGVASRVFVEASQLDQMAADFRQALEPPASGA